MTKKLKIEYRDVAELVPYARNARTHSDAQVAEIAGSIREFGFNDPIAVDGENGIIEGHGRVLAARQLGLERVPTIELSHLSTTQKKAYMLAHNRIALNSSWDVDLLQVEMMELSELGFASFEMLGFGETETAKLTSCENNQEPPQEFKEYDENIKTEKTCPKCGYRWSGGS